MAGERRVFGSRPRRSRARRGVVPVVCVAGLMMAAAGCGGDDAAPATTVTVEMPPTTVTAETPPETEARTETSSGTTTAGGGSVITLGDAESAALGFIENRDGQPASVTGSGPEDDFGAAWEVEVTREDGVEFDVYVDASGEVVRSVRGGGD